MSKTEKEINKIHQITAQTESEMNAIMNGHAAQKIAGNTVKTLDSILGEKPSSPYSFKHSSKGSEDIYGGMSDGTKRRR